MPTTVINKKTGEPFDIYIGRGSVWGNPFKMENQSSAERNRAILAYEEHLLSSPNLLQRLDELAGKRLACFCAPKRCHGDVLAYYANALVENGELPSAKFSDSTSPNQLQLPL